MANLENILNKWNKRFFSKENLLPSKDGVPPTSSQALKDITEYLKLLDSCRSMFDSLANERYERFININYFFGKQFCEKMPNPDYNPIDALLHPDSPARKKIITEEEYLQMKGMLPLSINVIRVACKAIVGLYTEERMEPLVKSRIREEQEVGEMLTEVMRYGYNAHNIYGSIIRNYEECIISARPIFRVGWKWYSQRKEYDICVEREDLNRMFWSSQVGSSDQYFEPVSTIGCLHDMSLANVLQEFATSPAVRDSIRAAYAECNEKYPLTLGQQGDRAAHTNISFYTTNVPNLCRVIEVWSKEAHDCYSCHDTGEGTSYTLPATAEAQREIEAINTSRIAAMVAAGGDPANAALIEYEYRVDQDWVCRYLTPNGYLLRQEVSPYLHGSHPWVLGAFPLIDGVARSLVADARNPQRMINRTFIRSEYSAMNETKGFKWVNQNILKRSNITIDDFRRQYTSTNGVVDLDIKQGEEKIIMGPVEQNKTNSRDDMNKIEFFNTILDKITGTPGAIRGEKPLSGTPSSLYAQESQNANNNLADQVKWYNGLVEQLDFKILMLVLQHYDKKRYLRIVGEKYIDAINYVLNCDRKEILCDVVLIKSPSNGIARAETEDMLRLIYPDIGTEMYLENTSTHGADKLLQQYRAKMAEQREQQMQQMAQVQQQAPQGQAYTPNNVDTYE